MQHETQRETTEGPDRTIFAKLRRWRISIGYWHEFVTVKNDHGVTSRELHVAIHRTPRSAGDATAISIRVDPPADRSIQEIIADDPRANIAPFIGRAADLGRATKNLIPVLERHDLPTDHAHSLLSALRERPERPTLKDHDATLEIQRQVEDVELRISQGVLPADEDAVERRAFWEDKLLKLRTPDGHARFRHRVNELLARPRSQEEDRKLLDDLRGERDREDRELAFEPIRLSTGTDALSRCKRWRALVEFGERFFARAESGEQTTSIETAVLAVQGYGDLLANTPLEVRWAQLLRDDTHGLRRHAEKAGISAVERDSISALTQAIDRLLEGGKVNLAALTQRVDAVVEMVATRGERSPTQSADRLHQVLVELHRAVEQVVALIAPDNIGRGLHVLDRYLVGCPRTPNERWPGGMHDIKWRTLAEALATRRAEADKLWSTELGVSSRTLHGRLTLAGSAPAKLAMLNENSHHALVLAVARIFVDGITKVHLHTAETTNVLDSRDATATTQVRQMLVEHMIESALVWPTETLRELEREHAAAVEDRFAASATRVRSDNPRAPKPSGQTSSAGEPGEAINPETLVTAKEISTETGIPYSTLMDRRRRWGKDAPEIKSKATDGSLLWRRGDWDDIVAAIRKSRGAP